MSRQKEDFYKILGVDKKCSDAEIKKAYRKLAMEWHPDKHVQDTIEEKKKAEEKFKEINQAYEVLGNQKNRQQYDTMGMGAFTDGFNNNNGYQFGNASDIFNTFFKSFNKSGFDFPMHGMKQMGGMRGARMFTDSSGRTVHISMSNGFDGGDTKTKRQRTVNLGPMFNDITIDESDSDDDLSSHKPPVKDEPIIVDFEVTLEELYKGVTKKRKITRTIKTKHMERSESETVIIDIKPGWKEGTKITFSNRGDINPGREPADIIFVVKQQPHPTFKRKDNDLATIITITKQEATDGFEKTIKDIFGNDIHISLKKGIYGSKYVHKIKGLGMPIRKEGQMIGYGDLLVDIIVQ